MIYAVSNHKGGVGKTTSTINIGAALAAKKKKVLLVDLDPQANLTQSLGINKVEITIYDNLRGEKLISPIEYKSNLYVLPSSLKIKDKYDYILIDCPPSLGLLTINALTAADFVIIPMQAEYLPLRGLAKLTEVINKIQARLNINLKIGCVFLTQYDSRKILNRDVADSVQEFFGNKFLKNKISSNVALAEAPSQGKDIFSYNKNCKGAEDYFILVEEIIESGVF